jgi:hypothetical protein
LKIKKYLIRQHFSDPKFEDPDCLRKRFQTLEFKDILSDLNMTRNEYVNALRMSVKGKCTVFHERRPGNLHTNNYNPGLLLLNGSNMDLTWISGILIYYDLPEINNFFPDAFATIAYILGYLTKVC